LEKEANYSNKEMRMRFKARTSPVSLSTVWVRRRGSGSNIPSSIHHPVPGPGNIQIMVPALRVWWGGQMYKQKPQIKHGQGCGEVNTGAVMNRSRALTFSFVKEVLGVLHGRDELDTKHLLGEKEKIGYGHEGLLQQNLSGTL
jgi:hypothetical protein